MYSIDVPIINDLRPEEREEFIELFKKTGTDRIFVSVTLFLGDRERFAKQLEAIKEKTEFFKSRSFRTGIWLYPTLGYGGIDSFSAYPGRYTPKRTLFVRNKDNFMKKQRKYSVGAACPLDKNFIRDFSECIALVAELQPEIIMLEDDFSLSSIDIREVCCCCPLHMREFQKRTGRKIKPEELPSLLYDGAPNEYRKTWYDLKRDTMLGFLRSIRSAVDTISPQTRIGLCANRSSYELDGASVQEMALTAAGNTRPFVRLTGAPYWEETSLAHNIETARLQAKWLSGSGIETLAEGDTYPRPRYRVSAARLEAFDMIMRADGNTDGILKYMVEYNSRLFYERGYIDAHILNLDAYRIIDRIFGNKKTVGVNVLERQNLIEGRVFDEIESLRDVANQAIFDTVAPTSLLFSKDLSLPTAFDCDDCASVVFGENARYVDEKTLRNGVVLDFKAAEILRERGFDVGMESYTHTPGPNLEYFFSFDDTVPVGNPNTDHEGKYFRITTKEGTIIDSEFRYPCKAFNLSGAVSSDETPFPACYRYENRQGQRFVVFSFVASTVHVRNNTPWVTGLFRNYYRQRQVISAIEWAQRKKLPATSTGNPDLFILCKKGKDSQAIGIWNLSEDCIPQATIKLDKNYRKAEYYFTEGTLSGDTIRLSKPLGAFGFAFIEVTE